jgi:hypothetical protein
MVKRCTKSGNGVLDEFRRELMSRSYKKVPIIKYDEFGKKAKHWANKKVRYADLGDYGDYKKLYDQYNIYDQICNLYNEYNMIDGIPVHIDNSKLTINEINEYWRK